MEDNKTTQEERRDAFLSELQPLMLKYGIVGIHPCAEDAYLGFSRINTDKSMVLGAFQCNSINWDMVDNITFKQRF